MEEILKKKERKKKRKTWDTHEPMFSTNITKNTNLPLEFNTPLPKKPIKLYKSINKWSQAIMEYNKFSIL